MKFVWLFLLFAVAVCQSYAAIFFQEDFADDSWESNWVYSKYQGSNYGKFVVASNKFYHDVNEKGLKISEPSKLYAISKKVAPFSNRGKTLVIQFSVKYEQKIECGGGYLKVFDCQLDQRNMYSKSPYEIMFGPDICGLKKIVHVIFNHNGKGILIKKNIIAKDDLFTHVYTLIVNPNNTYEVLIDNEKVEYGSLEDDWDFLPNKKIKIFSITKPANWDDRQTIDDPKDTKPENWDTKVPIAFPNAYKYMIYKENKRKWTPRKIKNPNYKGVWIQPEINNPMYVRNNSLYIHKEMCTVGLEIWENQSGTIFDNFLITDDIKVAKAAADKVLAMQVYVCKYL